MSQHTTRSENAEQVESADVSGDRFRSRLAVQCPPGLDDGAAEDEGTTARGRGTRWAGPRRCTKSNGDICAR
ncbi:unnamed protein product, partial [Iphiclides podalirius]